MSLINDIAAILQSNISGNNLTIQSSDFDDEISMVKKFLEEGLEKTEMEFQAIPGTDLVNETNEKVVVQGTTELFDLVGLVPTLTFEESSAGQLEITMETAFPNPITLNPIDWIALENANRTVAMDVDENITQTIQGTMQLGASNPIAIQIRTTTSDNENWELAIDGGDGQRIQLQNDRDGFLDAIADLMNIENGLSAFIPEAAIDVLNGVALTGISSSYDTSNNTISEFKIGLVYAFGNPSNTGSWNIAPQVKINDLAFILNIKNVTDADTRTLEGTVEGSIDIGSIKIPIHVTGSIDDPNWNIALPSGETLTSFKLSDFLQKILDEERLNELPEQIKNLPDLQELTGMEVTHLKLNFNSAENNTTNNPTIELMEIGIAAIPDAAVSLSSWSILEDETGDYLAVGLNEFNLSIENLLSPTRVITPAISVFTNIGGTALDFDIRIEEDEATEVMDWKFSGQIREGEPPLSLTNIANDFLTGLAIPTEIENVNASFSTANFTAFLKQKKLDFELEFGNDLVIVGDYGVRSLKLLGKYDGTQTTNKISGQVEGSVNAGTDISMLAELSEDGSGVLFQTMAAVDTPIQIGEMVAALINDFGSDVEAPASLEGVEISNLGATYDTRGEEKNLEITFTTLLPTEDVDIMLTVLLNNTIPKDGSPTASVYTGNIIADLEEGASIDALHFLVEFSKDAQQQVFTAALEQPEDDAVSIASLIGAFSPEAGDFLNALELDVEIFGAKVSYQKDAPPQGATPEQIAAIKGNFLFCIQLGTQMSFSNLPLVGDMLPADSNIEVKDIKISYTTTTWSQKDLANLNKKAREKFEKEIQNISNGTPKKKKRNINLPEVDIKRGINMLADFTIGKIKQTINLPMWEPAPNGSSGSTNGNAGSGGSSNSNNNSTTTTITTSKSTKGKWFEVNKTLGPLELARVGVNFEDSVLWFLLDASLSVGPLTMVLDDFGVGSPIDHFDPQISLRGFGLVYENGPVSIGGAFLRRDNEFAGAATIKTTALTISAIGAYTTVNNNGKKEPSFFLYAYLGYPIGGPSFFFVEGLALGFGYNRIINMPGIGQVAEFPFVKIAFEGLGDDLSETLNSLIDANHFPVNLGQIFIAAGIRFTSFKILDSFLLVAATFGDSFRLDLLGMSKLVLPPPTPGKSVPPVAEIELAIAGSFIPDEGFLGVQAQLTNNSYILSRDCSLTGGFAFFSWFSGERQGDFVLTLGGYHPRYKKPAHYPSVPRIGFNWRVSSVISISGGMYFALTPSMVMAGGSLSAMYHDGNLKAWFEIGANLLLSWKPYFYDIELYLRMGIKYTFWFFGKQTLSIELGADLRIWGPEFAGTARIDISVATVTVRFGAQGKPAPKPLPWSDFKKSFLPAPNLEGIPAEEQPKEETRVSVSIISGLLKGDEDKKLWIINPKEFELATDSIIPAKQGFKLANGTRTSFSSGHETNFGIGSMKVKPNQLTTSQTIQILKEENDTFADKTDDFDFANQRKPVPEALWGQNFKADVKATKGTIKNTLAGAKIKPKPIDAPDVSQFIEQEKFDFDTLPLEDVFDWSAELAFDGAQGEVVVEENNNRDEILEQLGFENEFEINDNTDFAFSENPLIGEYA